MAFMRITRFRVAERDVEEMLRRRRTLIEVIRRDHPGLTEARLARSGEEGWMDSWRWDTAAHLQAALAAAPTIPEAGAAFSLATDLSAETAEIVDER